MLLALTSSLYSRVIQQAILSLCIPLKSPVWNLQTLCRAKLFTIPLTNVPETPTMAAGATPRQPPGQQRRSASQRRNALTANHAVTPCDGWTGWASRRLLLGSDTVQSSVIFGRRITLCHGMDLLILLPVCVYACVHGSIWSLSTVAVSCEQS